MVTVLSCYTGNTPPTVCDLAGCGCAQLFCGSKEKKKLTTPAFDNVCSAIHLTATLNAYLRDLSITHASILLMMSIYHYSTEPFKEGFRPCTKRVLYGRSPKSNVTSCLSSGGGPRG